MKKAKHLKGGMLRRTLSFALTLGLVLSLLTAGITAGAAPADFAGGSGTQEDPWLISTPEQLQALGGYTGAAGASKYFRLANDIDLASYLSAEGAGYNGGEGWIPVGSVTSSFAGNFEGGGHVVMNLEINRPAADFQGLFGCVGGNGSISNLGLIDANVTGKEFTGALAGQNSGAAITSCYSAASAPGEASVTGTAEVGGLVGLNMGVLTGCFAEGDVAGMQFVGGLAGNCLNPLDSGAPLLFRCFASGDVSGMVTSGTGTFIGGLAGGCDGNISECYASGAVVGKENTGGLVGYTYPGNELTKSYAAGDVTGNANWTGGLVGYNSARISQCYATGAVTGTNAVGGLAGMNYTASATAVKGTIVNSYAAGNVTGTATGMHIGGLVGNNSANSVISACYASGDVVGIAHVGGLAGTGNGSVTNSAAANGSVSGPEEIVPTDIGQVSGYKNGTAVALGCCAYDSMAITPAGANLYSGTTATLAELQTETFYTDNSTSRWSASDTLWDFDGTWTMPEEALPVLTAFSEITDASITGVPEGGIVGLNAGSATVVTLSAALTPQDAAQPVHYGWSLPESPEGSAVSVSYDGANKILVPDMAGTYTAAVGVTGYNGSTASASVTVEVHAYPAAAGVDLSGAPHPGHAVTGVYAYSDAENDEESGSAYQWYLADDGTGTNESAISGATEDTYAPSSSDMGKYVCFEVTPKDAYSTGESVKSGYAEVTEAPTTSSHTTYYSVSADQSAGGTIALSYERVRKGGSVTVTVTPGDGYSVSDVQVNGESVGAVTKYTVLNVTQDITVTASFERSWKNPFDDVSDGDWYFDAVEYVCAHDLFTGASADRFEPDKPMTRAMLATVLFRMSGVSGSYGNTFSDVPNGAWYEKAVSWTTAAGITDGVGGGMFDPDTPVTREQMAAMIYHYAQFRKLDTAVPGDGVLDGFTDSLSVSSWAKDAMKWAVGTGLIEGSGGLLNPGVPATRAQVAQVIARFLGE